MEPDRRDARPENPRPERLLLPRAQLPREKDDEDDRHDSRHQGDSERRTERRGPEQDEQAGGKDEERVAGGVRMVDAHVDTVPGRPEEQKLVPLPRVPRERDETENDDGRQRRQRKEVPRRRHPPEPRQAPISTGPSPRGSAASGHCASGTGPRPPLRPRHRAGRGTIALVAGRRAVAHLRKRRRDVGPRDPAERGRLDLDTTDEDLHEEVLSGLARPAPDEQVSLDLLSLHRAVHAPVQRRIDGPGRRDALDRRHSERRREGHLEHDEVDQALPREERERQGCPAQDRKTEPGQGRLHLPGVFLEGDRAGRPSAARGERRVEALQVQRSLEQPFDLEPDHRGVAVEEGHEPVGLGPRVDPDRARGDRLPLFRGEEGAKVAVAQEKERVPRRGAGRVEDGGPAAPIRPEHEHDAARGLRRGEEQEGGGGDARSERRSGGLTGFLGGRSLDELRGDERDQRALRGARGRGRSGDSRSRGSTGAPRRRRWPRSRAGARPSGMRRARRGPAPSRARGGRSSRRTRKGVPAGAPRGAASRGPRGRRRGPT